ncbi:MAG: hypothetical protein M1510_02025 [Nitrospirae bacterium]|nr:hypothetical protein [Nitrospirota bacterium]MCL5237014.1 hypothetical protein [Nitrospirota bacterium]
MRNAELWVFIFLLGLLGLNWPIIEIFHIDVIMYLFVFWLLFIGLVAYAAHKSGMDRKPGNTEARKPGSPVKKELTSALPISRA